MQRVAADLGITSLTAVQYNERGEFSSTTILRRFQTWNNALKAANLGISNRQDISNDELFENLAKVWTKLGRQPLGREMSEQGLGSLFSRGTYEKRFGTWNSSLLAFANFINSSRDNPVVDDVSEASPLKTEARRRRTSREINWRLRAKILIRDSCICKMCGDSPAKNPASILHVDHILAWANGGETVEENLQTLCAKCNIGKSDAIF
jgi:HNH endonuclease/Homing endonuclease associated repeat